VSSTNPGQGELPALRGRGEPPLPVLTVLPFEPRLDDFIDEGQPIVTVEPKAEFSKQFRCSSITSGGEGDTPGTEPDRADPGHTPALLTRTRLRGRRDPRPPRRRIDPHHRELTKRLAGGGLTSVLSRDGDTALQEALRTHPTWPWWTPGPGMDGIQTPRCWCSTANTGVILLSMEAENELRRAMLRGP